MGGDKQGLEVVVPSRFRTCHTVKYQNIILDDLMDGDLNYFKLWTCRDRTENTRSRLSRMGRGKKENLRATIGHYNRVEKETIVQDRDDRYGRVSRGIASVAKEWLGFSWIERRWPKRSPAIAL